MDLDDQELFYTQILNKVLKDKDLKRLRKEYTDKIIADKEEIKDLLKRINIIDKKLGELERWVKKN